MRVEARKCRMEWTGGMLVSATDIDWDQSVTQYAHATCNLPGDADKVLQMTNMLAR